MQKRKSPLLTALSLIVLLALSPFTTATATAVMTQTATEAVVNLMLDPRFDYMSRISSSLSVGTLGRASCTGSFTTYDNVDSTITITLQQFKGGEWSAIKEWSEDYTGTGVKMLDKGYYVASGYRYRLTTMVQIYRYQRGRRVPL